MRTKYTHANTHIYICRIHANKVHANTCKYMQIHANTCRYMQIHANTCKYIWPHVLPGPIHDRCMGILFCMYRSFFVRIWMASSIRIDTRLCLDRCKIQQNTTQYIDGMAQGAA